MRHLLAGRAKETNVKRRLVLLLVGALILGGLGRAVAQGGAEANWWVVASGGGRSMSGMVTINDSLGQPVIDLAQGGTVTLGAGYWYPGMGPTSVSLVSFDAVPQGTAIRVTWETALETNNVGFNLYRAESPSGPLAQLNDTLIPSQVAPGSPSGAVYEWLDQDGLVPGQVYYYWPEAVDIHGRSTRYGPLQATAGGGEALYLPVVWK
jgi:hypothetical protein